MELREQLNGIQHVGIPTNDIEMTIAFYEKLGFEIAFRTVNEAADEKVAFLKLGTLVIETYENKAAGRTGSVCPVWKRRCKPLCGEKRC